MDDSASERCRFSVVVPTYNEEDSIGDLLDSILSADYPKTDIEVVIADGMSEDRTRAIVCEYIERNSTIELHDNPDRHTPNGINVGFEASNGEIVVLVGGHSTLPTDFFRRIEEAFERAPDAGVVGGVMEPEPSTYFETAVSMALVSPLGASSNRFSEYEGYVETVNYGAYKRSVVQEVGLMDTSLPRAQDYEYNRRVRKHGIKIYQYPKIRVAYHPRSTPSALTRQYFGNGYWKAQVFQNNHGCLTSLALANGVIAGTAAMVLLGPLLLLSVGYLVAVTLAVRRARSRFDSDWLWHAPVTVVSLILMHTAYFCGFVTGTLSVPE